jgi:hypothetical protein
VSAIIFIALLVGFPIVCGILALRRHQECPRERMGYNCHVYRNGYCNACGRKSKVTSKEDK